MGCGASADAGRQGAPAKQDVLAGIQDNIQLDKLPACIADLHHGMPDVIKQAPMRLLRVASVLSWQNLLAYEEVINLACINVPYSEISNAMWDQTAVLSWRWSAAKPVRMQQGFSPMSAQQFRELTDILTRLQTIAVQYVWIDWCCVPQYSASPMVEVLRSKVFYARARVMTIVPTFNPFPKESVVHPLLGKAETSLKRRSAESSVAALAASTVDTILTRELVAGREYFTRVWTLAERMARYGRSEQLRNWLTLDAWLGMVVDAMLNSTEDKSASQTYLRILGKDAAEMLATVLQSLADAVKTDNLSVAEGLEDTVAELFMTATSMWQSTSVTVEAPTKAWLLIYMEEISLGIYQAWDESDRVWAIYSYFCWKQVDQTSKDGLMEALSDLVRVADAGRKCLVSLAGKFGLAHRLPMDEKDEKLLTAVEGGNLEEVQSLLAAGANPQTLKLDGSYPLHIVADKGYAEIARALVKAGVDTEQIRPPLVTPLLVAGKNGYADVVRVLLEAGAKKEAATEDGATALYRAAENGHVEALRVLMQAGANKAVLTKEWYTPLLAAALNGHVEVVKVLLKAGAPKNSALDDGATALYLAAEKQHIELVNALLEAGVDTELCILSGATPLYIASSNGDIATVEALLRANANPNAARKDSSSPLYVASDRGHVEVVRALLAAGANKEHKFKTGATPVIVAAQAGGAEVVAALADAGADTNVRIGKDGTTPLITAAKRNRTAVAEVLLEKGADKDLALKDGATALFIAAEVGHVEITRVLLEAGANSELKCHGRTPLLVATFKEHTEVVKALLVGGASKEARLADGKTALHQACANGCGEIVEALLEAGADKDAVTENGATPLYLAAKKGSADVVKALLKAGADKDIPAKNNKKPIDVAGMGIAELLARD